MKSISPRQSLPAALLRWPQRLHSLDGRSQQASLPPRLSSPHQVDHSAQPPQENLPLIHNRVQKRNSSNQPSEEEGEGEPERMLCGGREVFLRFPLGRLATVGPAPAPSRGPPTRGGRRSCYPGRGQRQPRRQGEAVAGGGEAIGQLCFKLLPTAAGASHTLYKCSGRYR